MKVHRLIFRDFPDNNWLRGYWWHRAALVVAPLLATVCYFYVLLLVGVSGLGVERVVLAAIPFVGAYFGIPLIYKALLYVFTINRWKE